MGMPMEPNATGAVFANKQTAAAINGVNPRPVSIVAATATGVPFVTLVDNRTLGDGTDKDPINGVDPGLPDNFDIEGGIGVRQYYTIPPFGGLEVPGGAEAPTPKTPRPVAVSPTATLPRAARLVTVAALRTGPPVD